MTLEYAHITHVGLVRAENQDRFLCRPELGLFAVCDGMGGHAGGDVAAQIAVDTIGETFDHLDSMPVDPTLATTMGLAAIEAAHLAIRRYGQVNPALRNMGTTVASLMLLSGVAVVTHVGDSRVYVSRRAPSRRKTGRSKGPSLLHQLTKDHGNGHHLYQALGLDKMTPESKPLVIEPGDVFLLCSDGLHGMIGPETIGAILGSDDTAANIGERLLGAVLKKGAHDNVTAIVVRT
jgi:serine/threonine protein phosphatase PrpC